MNNLRATGYLRPLNRQSSEHLILGADGNIHSVDLQTQWGTRTTILNALGSRLCRIVGIETANPVLLNIGPEILKLAINGAPRDPGGTFVGTRYPVNPLATAVYDFLPNSVLRQVDNLVDFWRLIPIDLWLGNQKASRVLFHRPSPPSPMYRSTIVFRSAPEPIHPPKVRAVGSDLPTLALGHYGGSSGSSDAEAVAARLLAMTSSDLAELLDDLGGNSHEPWVKTIGVVAEDLVSARDTIFRDFAVKLRTFQNRVDAASNDRKPPRAEVTCGDLKGVFDQTLGATAGNS